jgi:phosphate transport system permease protein
MTSVQTDPAVDSTQEPTAPRGRGWRATLLAVLVALVVVELMTDVLGVSNPLVVGLSAYGAFLVVNVSAYSARRRAQRAPAPSAPVPEAPFAPDAVDLQPPDAPTTEFEPITRYGSTNVSMLDAMADDLLLPDAPTTEFEPIAPVLPPSVARRQPPPDIDLPALEREEEVVDDRPMRRRAYTRTDVVELVFAVASGAALAGIQRAVTDSTGFLGTGLLFLAFFLVVYFFLIRDRLSPDAATDRVVTVLVWIVGAIVVALLTWMIVFLIGKGLPALRTGFFTDDLSEVGPLNPGGGAFHSIVGTFEQVGLATLIVVPVAILTAVYLHEVRGPLAIPVRLIVDAMSGLPSIIAGLFIFTIWVDGRGFSGAAGAAALVVLMLPTVTRASEEILRTVPDNLREASLALGAPQWKVVTRVVLPTARAGLVTAAILGVARGVGETAPVLFTAFGSDSTNWNPLNGPQSNLPLFVWKLIRVPNETQNQRAWTGALVLVFFVLVLFVLARFVSNRGTRRLEGRR